MGHISIVIFSSVNSGVIVHLYRLQALFVLIFVAMFPTKDFNAANFRFSSI